MATAEKAKNRITEVNGVQGSSEHKVLTISAPKFEVLVSTIVGTAPLVINAFSRKALDKMKQAQLAGSQAKKGGKREAKDFQAAYEGAKHISEEGWCGIPATSFRAAMISACRLVGFKMTHAKLGIYIQADGYDVIDGTALVRITKGEPRYVEHAVRNATGVADIRARPMWNVGWESVVRIRYDSDMFCGLDVANLLSRVGMQVGIGEGRPDSKDSCGLGWGLFDIKE